MLAVGSEDRVEDALVHLGQSCDPSVLRAVDLQHKIATPLLFLVTHDNLDHQCGLPDARTLSYAGIMVLYIAKLVTLDGP